jgi:hypothetical protein
MFLARTIIISFKNFERKSKECTLKKIREISNLMWFQYFCLLILVFKSRRYVQKTTDLFDLLVSQEVHQLLHVLAMASAIFLNRSALQPKIEITSAQN